MKKIYIYILKDPTTELVRYVGKTVNPTKRLQNHINRAKYLKFHSAAWINSLLICGLRPVMNIIETADTNNWEEREKYWISFYRNEHDSLTNVLNGGEGGHGGFGNPNPWTEERRENYRKGRTGVKMPNQNDKNGLRKAGVRAYRARTAKPICQYDLDGNFVQEWSSSSECGRKTGFNYSNINDVLDKGNSRQSFGFMWRYKKEAIALKIEPYVKSPVHNCKSVIKMNEHGEILVEYDSIFTAAKENGVSRSAIVNGLSGRSKKCAGFFWKYKKEV
jgi:hypothetical protein